MHDDATGKRVRAPVGRLTIGVGINLDDGLARHREQRRPGCLRHRAPRQRPPRGPLRASPPAPSGGPCAPQCRPARAPLPAPALGTCFPEERSRAQVLADGLDGPSAVGPRGLVGTFGQARQAIRQCYAHAHPSLVGVRESMAPGRFLTPAGCPRIGSTRQCLQHSAKLRRSAGVPSLSQSAHPCPRPQSS